MKILSNKGKRNLSNSRRTFEEKFIRLCSLYIWPNVNFFGWFGCYTYKKATLRSAGRAVFVLRARNAHWKRPISWSGVVAYSYSRVSTTRRARVTWPDAVTSRRRFRATRVRASALVNRGARVRDRERRRT